MKSSHWLSRWAVDAFRGSCSGRLLRILQWSRPEARAFSLQVKEEEKRRREEELELRRLAKVEEERGLMVAERQAGAVLCETRPGRTWVRGPAVPHWGPPPSASSTAATKAQQKQAEAAQRRLRRAAPKSVEEQALELPEVCLSPSLR